MKRCIPVILIVSVVFGTLEAPPARAQMSAKEVVNVGGWIGGLMGTYSGGVCYVKENCTGREAWMLLGIYTGAGIGTIALLNKVGSSKKQPAARPAPAPYRPDDFSQIQFSVKKGDHISVRDASGKMKKGVIESITSSSLKLRTGQSSRDYSNADVTEIYQRRRQTDSYGPIPLTLASVVVGAIVIPQMNTGRWCTGKGAGTCVAGAGALGAGIYLGLSSIPKRTRIYKSTPQRTTGIDWRVAPVVSKDTRGAAMRISF